MINVSLENETDWIVRGTVTSDVSEINLENDAFRIELKDLLEHYVKRDTTTELVEAYQKDSTQTLSISNNEVKLVPLKCPICKGTGLAVDNYPMGRNKIVTTLVDNKYDYCIVEKKASVFVNPLIQLSDYSDLPDTYFPDEFPWAAYGHTEIEDDPSLIGILTYTNSNPYHAPTLYKIEGTNEYYYYRPFEISVNNTYYTIKKRQKFSIQKCIARNLPDVLQDGEVLTYYGYCGEKIWYLKSDPTHYYYYTYENDKYVKKENCYYCQDTYGYSTGNDPNAYTICDDVPKQILTEEFYSNISTYNNSDMKSLIENGFQFWVSEDKTTLYFRLTIRGKSSTNPNGYEDKLKTELYKNDLYDKTADDIEVKDGLDENEKGTLYTGRVGFTLAICSISLDSTHRICFNITIAPTFKSSDIFRVKNEDDYISQIPNLPTKVCPICGDTHYQINYSAFENNSIILKHEVECSSCDVTSGYYMDRYAYPYYNAKKFDDMIFLNNHSATYSSTFDTYWDEQKYKYVTSSTKDYDATRTNLYAAYTSAIIPAYLVSGSTIDVLSQSHIYTTGVRNFEFNYDESVVSSYLLDSDKSRYCELPWDGNPKTLNGFVYVEENGACIYDDLNVNLIRQDIDVGVVGETIDDMVGKTVFFGTEV